MSKYAEPKHSCGAIDDAISTIRDIHDQLKRAWSRGSAEDFPAAVESALGDLAALDLEPIRKINEELRTWGSAWRDRAEEAEDNVSTAECRIAELERETTGAPSS